MAFAYKMTNEMKASQKRAKICCCCCCCSAFTGNVKYNMLCECMLSYFSDVRLLVSNKKQ